MRKKKCLAVYMDEDGFLTEFKHKSFEDEISKFAGSKYSFGQ